MTIKGIDFLNGDWILTSYSGLPLLRE
ncbi:uncharacterized protein METZ01_LOCUS86530 [marine metagenome]|uniref:Uncharacterized protein n=1 Tax=marine metagenome TaxID=408172 RepID=A0A381UZW3_9ZZZZ